MVLETSTLDESLINLFSSFYNMKLDPHLNLGEFDKQTSMMRVISILRDTHDWTDTEKPSVRELAFIINSITLERVISLLKKLLLAEQKKVGKKIITYLTKDGLQIADHVKSIESILQLIESRIKQRQT
jgi:hypothetical protein